MLSNILIRLGLTNKKVNIALWGPDVSEITTLVHALSKTGEYVRRSRESAHPFSQEIYIGNVTITATVPSANMGARRAWRSALSDFDGIVYLVDVTDPAWLALSKEELDSLLNDDALSKPILVLVPRSIAMREEELRRHFRLDFQEAITKGERRVALFMYSISLTQFEGTEAGFQWLIQHV